MERSFVSGIQYVLSLEPDKKNEPERDRMGRRNEDEETIAPEGRDGH